MRTPLPEIMMLHAQVAALRSTCKRLSVGAVVARDDRILSTGYNGAARGEDHCTCGPSQACTQAVHAEVNALLFAGRGSESTVGAQMYLTHTPCYDCAGMIINAGIEKIWYAFKYRDDRGWMRCEMAGVRVFCWTPFEEPDYPTLRRLG